MTELKCITVREATESLVIREPMLCKWKKDFKQKKLQAFLGNGPKLEVEPKKGSSCRWKSRRFMVNSGTVMVIAGSTHRWFAKAYWLVATRCSALGVMQALSRAI
jgi:hypothetical protein